jgi:2-iminobutanoate/2-iminopropanoate deaminase
MKTILTDQAPQPVGPYSQAILTEPGALLFLSGQLGLDPLSGELAKGGVEGQIKQALKNMEAILTAARMGKNNIVKTTIFLKDLNNFATVNDLYETFFGDHKPARSTIEVSRLPKGGLVEIEAIALMKWNKQIEEGRR